MAKFASKPFITGGKIPWNIKLAKALPTTQGKAGDIVILSSEKDLLNIKSVSVVDSSVDKILDPSINLIVSPSAPKLKLQEYSDWNFGGCVCGVSVMNGGFHYVNVCVWDIIRNSWREIPAIFAESISTSKVFYKSTNISFLIKFNVNITLNNKHVAPKTYVSQVTLKPVFVSGSGLVSISYVSKFGIAADLVVTKSGAQVYP